MRVEPGRTELDARLEAVAEDAGAGRGLDLVSWLWLVSLGVAGPAALLAWGWR